MRRFQWMASICVLALIGTLSSISFAAYHHMGEGDSAKFLEVYPEREGSKLDSCALCHTGGKRMQGGKEVSLGSCQWCHYKYGYDATGNIEETLNNYAKDFRNAGRDADALRAIAKLDSDGDGYKNDAEIAALRYPGDAADTPERVAAPYRIFTRREFERLPAKYRHSQCLLMNTHKSGDFYAKYHGIVLGDLLEGLMLESATGIQVIAADGWSQYHPLFPDADPLLYHVFGDYPQAVYYYEEEADAAKNPGIGWCDYSAACCAHLKPYRPIHNPRGLKLLLAFKRGGEYLNPGVLNEQNKLDGEGPFRVIPPQKNPGPPDQGSTSGYQNVIWPFDNDADHNAGFSSRTVTMIKVEPLPEGTTDIDTLEAGWEYVDANKVIVYGAIDPHGTLVEKADALLKDTTGLSTSDFRCSFLKHAFLAQLRLARFYIVHRRYAAALIYVEKRLMGETDGCIAGAQSDPREKDWITNCETQKQIYWALNEIKVLLNVGLKYGPFEVAEVK
ncbi:MAG: hypothetical protein GX443_16635 [Deltaproteobacteria bacterium]|nr:hypothetical protein [Deltaproteobacteria bacterium]